MSPVSPSQKAASRVEGLLKFLGASPSPFHAINEAKSLLRSRGFIQLNETESWKLENGGKYFFTRNGSSLVAFSIGLNFSPLKSGMKLIAAHSDSPCLRIKPLSKKLPKEGFLQVAVETYGGGIWHTWFDRDLGIAGRIVTRSQANELKESLVQVDRPILRVPTLAIHLDRSVKEGFKFNEEIHLTPVLATELSVKSISDNGKQEAMHKTLHSLLVPDDGQEILASEICLYDLQKPSKGGANDEFIFSARLDNLFMSYCAICALCECLDSKGSAASDSNLKMIVLYDNEEVGSLSANGAESTLISSCVTSIMKSFSASNEMGTLLSRSFLVSADMAHAVHPNYPYNRLCSRSTNDRIIFWLYREKHDECHRPMMQKGIVIKYNSNQRYTSNSRSAAFIKSLAMGANIPFQEFMVRNDSPCGSTIGPIVSAQLGIQAVDVGAPQLSMHSIREMAGTADVDNSIRLFVEVFQSEDIGINSLDI